MNSLSSYFLNSMCFFIVQYLNMMNRDVQVPAVYLTLTFLNVTACDAAVNSTVKAIL